MILTSRRMLTDAGLVPGWVRLEGGTIAACGLGTPGVGSREATSGPTLDLGERALSAGLVDVHCHGGGGGSFTSGAVDEARRAVRTHREAGTTSIMASLVTDAVPNLLEQVEGLAGLVAEGELLGIHLEGPCLSALHRGAHEPSLLRAPADVDVATLARAGGGAVAMMTLATELPGGLDAVRTLREAGVVAALGHTDATYEQAREALAAGVEVATHLCNAMRGLHHREPGPILACLLHESAWLEVIADGVHSAWPVVAGLFAAAPDRVVLVTDAMSAAGMSDGTTWLGPLEVNVRDGVARLVSTGAIAGSTLTLAEAVRRCVRDAGLDLATVLPAATAHPADLLGRTDIGRLVAGARADLVVLDGGASPGEDVQVTAVMRGGRWLRSPEGGSAPA